MNVFAEDYLNFRKILHGEEDLSHKDMERSALMKQIKSNGGSCGYVVPDNPRQNSCTKLFKWVKVSQCTHVLPEIYYIPKEKRKTDLNNNQDYHKISEFTIIYIIP